MDKQLALERYETFLKGKRKHNGDKLVPSTIERYMQWIQQYIVTLESMDPDKKMVEYMSREVEYRNSSVLHSVFYNYLLMRKADPGLMVSLSKADKRANAATSERFLQTKVLSRGELRRVMNETEDDLFLHTAISCLYDTACRRSELLSIKWGDIQFKDPIKHSEEIKNGLSASVTIMGKGKKTREVYFGKTSVELLQKMNAIEHYTKDSIVFVSKDNSGKPYMHQDHGLYEIMVKRLYKILGRRVHPHMLRHTKLTHLADAGAQILDLASYAGHSDIKVTEIYIHISSFRGRQAYMKYSNDIMSES